MNLARLDVFGLCLALVACRPELEDRDWLVDSVHILAVKGEPAEAKPGELVRFTAFIAPSDLDVAASDLDWRFCSAPRPTTENNVVSSVCLTSNGALSRVGRGLTIDAPTPLDGCSLFGPDTPPGDFRPRDADASGGYYQPLRLDLPGAVPAVHLQRLSCGLAEASADTASAFSMRYVPNQNPTLGPLVARSSGQAVELKDIRRGQSLELEVSWPAEAAETYAYYDRATQAVIARRESLRVAWYVDGGTLDTETTGRAEDDTQLATGNRWSAPDVAATYHLWLVLRDSRGGADFAQYVLGVVPSSRRARPVESAALRWRSRMQVATRLPLVFRRRRATDDAFIARLSVSAFGEYAKNPEWTTLELAYRSTTWLAWNGDRPVGFAIYEGAGAARAHLTAIAVEEHARGAGVGSALLAHVERELAAAGTLELRLTTAVANVSAFELFLKRGFRVTRRVPRSYRGVFDARELSKRLRSAGR